MTQKHRLLVLVCWALSIGTTAWLGCPPGAQNLDARIYAVPNRSPIVYGITNRSDAPWHDVVITVNKRFQTVVSRIEADESIVLTPSKLFDEMGNPANELLVIDEVHVQTRTRQFSLRPGADK